MTAQLGNVDWHALLLLVKSKIWTHVEGLNSVVLSDDGMLEGNQMVSTLEATIKAVKEFNAEIIVGIDNTFLSPYILVC